MEVEVLADAQALAKRGAELIAKSACDAVAARGQFLVALSGGRTPWMMLEYLCRETLPWDNVQIFQVDERVAAQGSGERNLLKLRESLRAAPLKMNQIHAMPVEMDNQNAAIDKYAAALRKVAGAPPVIDLVHLGLGSDGHTASLLPNDAVLEEASMDIAISGSYQGTQRMTMTYPLINRARNILWVVSGADKAFALERLLAGDDEIPAGRIRKDNAVLLADKAAAGDL